MADVAVLGVGRMGAAVIRRLAAGGHSVTAWNRTRATADELAASMGRQSGIVIAASPAAAVAGADVVISMLASGPVTEQVIASADVLGALRPTAIVCDMGTSGVATAHALERALTDVGRAFVDAPVSGSVPTVAAGQVLVMAGGATADVASLRPVLGAFAKEIVHVGGVGAGQAMKLAVNLVVHDLNAAVSEALVLATRAGIEPDVAYDVFEASVIGAPFVRYKREAFLAGGGSVAMSLGLVAKDLALITDLADHHQVGAAVTRAVQAEVEAACSAGFGGEDMAALARHLAVAGTEPQNT
jgi:3-hydroxyisobutyrate dehydrogenase-like beta-hydroxyacid dehydrogenase